MIEVLLFQPMEMFEQNGWECYRPVGKRVLRITLCTDRKFLIWENYL